MSDAIVIRPERPDQPEVVQLLESLDRYLAALYPPEANFILSVQELLAPEVSFYVARAGTRVVGTGACRRMPAEPATAQVAHHRWQQHAPLVVGQAFGHAVSHGGHQRVCGAQVDADGDAPLVGVRGLPGFGDLQQCHGLFSVYRSACRLSRRRSMSWRKRATNINART